MWTCLSLRTLNENGAGCTICLEASEAACAGGAALYQLQALQGDGMVHAKRSVAAGNRRHGGHRGGTSETAARRQESAKQQGRALGGWHSMDKHCMVGGGWASRGLTVMASGDVRKA